MSDTVKSELRLPKQVAQQLTLLKTVSGFSKNELLIQAAKNMICNARKTDPQYDALCKALEDGE